uniref:Partner of Y14 and mago n=1 Tax=Parascaris univalens TaxID=6257 RepID=A0A915CCT9_PARUN
MTPKETTPHKVSTIMSFGEYSNKFKLRDAIKLQKLRFCGASKWPSESLFEHKLPYVRANNCHLIHLGLIQASSKSTESNLRNALMTTFCADVAVLRSKKVAI